MKNLFKKIINFLDLDTIPKFLSFLAELVPFVGIGYAIIGYNLAGQKLKKIDRLIYIVGEIIASGHIINAVRHSVAKHGTKKAAGQFAKATAQSAGVKIGERAVSKAQKTAVNKIIK
ncbi:MAG: hypothetical protein ABID45_02310 [Patescibacteria group bacterium]